MQSGPPGSAMPRFAASYASAPSASTVSYPAQQAQPQRWTRTSQNAGIAPNMAITKYEELMTLDRQIVSSNFAMSWPEHCNVVEQMLTLLRSYPADDGVMFWLASPDPLHNAGAQRRLWWQIRVVIERNRDEVIKRTMTQDQNTSSQQQERRRDANRAPAAKGYPDSSEPRTSRQENGEPKAQASPQTTTQPTSARNVPPTSSPNQRSSSASTFHQPSTPHADQWTAICCLVQRLQDQYTAGATWARIEGTTKAIIVKLKTIANSSNADQHDVPE